TDIFLEHDPRLRAGQRKCADGCEDVCRADGRVAGEGHLATRREDAHATRVLRIVRRKDERRFGVVELTRDAGHLLGGEAAGVGEDSELVAAELRVSEHVGSVELVGHVRHWSRGWATEVAVDSSLSGWPPTS